MWHLTSSWRESTIRTARIVTVWSTCGKYCLESASCSDLCQTCTARKMLGSRNVWKFRDSKASKPSLTIVLAQAVRTGYCFAQEHRLQRHCCTLPYSHSMEVTRRFAGNCVCGFVDTVPVVKYVALCSEHRGSSGHACCSSRQVKRVNASKTRHAAWMPKNVKTEHRRDSVRLIH